MPIDKSKYPDNWNKIARECKEVAGWKCINCGVGHMEDGTMGSCLTVHHPDLDTENPEARIDALCARCHLRADRLIRKTELEKKQLKLPFKRRISKASGFKK